MTATAPSVTRVYVGTSGWSYPSWRPGFYPAGTRPEEFLSFYAERFPTVELNTTGYRIPSEQQFERWVERTPPGFLFAPKLIGHARAQVGTFGERVRALGDRLGPVRILVNSARDEGLLALLGGSLDPGLRLAWDFRHDSWDGVALPPGSVAVNDLESEAPFRYLRLREPPYSDAELGEWAARIRGATGQVFVYVRHEDEPTAPAHARRLLELVESWS